MGTEGEILDGKHNSPAEELAEYEKEMEDVAPVTPPITKRQTTRRQVERPAGTDTP